MSDDGALRNNMQRISLKIHCRKTGAGLMLGSALDCEFLTLQSVGRQLSAMPNQVYLNRLIHSVGHRPAPGQRLWNAQELARNTVVRFPRTQWPG